MLLGLIKWVPRARSIVDSAYLEARTRNLLTVNSMTLPACKHRISISYLSNLFMAVAEALGAIRMLYEIHTATPTGNTAYGHGERIQSLTDEIRLSADCEI